MPMSAYKYQTLGIKQMPKHKRKLELSLVYVTIVRQAFFTIGCH